MPDDDSIDAAIDAIRQRPDLAEEFTGGRRVLRAMLPWVEARHHELCEAARECYRLRNTSDLERAVFYNDLGDVLFARARAMLAEWEH